jgi:hypothetical protein
MTTVHHRYATVNGRQLFYRDAWTEVSRACGLLSFEPDRVSVHLDGIRLRLEPGQAVIPHGIDRDLTVDEAVPGGQR